MRAFDVSGNFGGLSVVGDKTEKTILVVEDDADMNELMCTVLEEAGYRTISVSNGEHGIESVKTNKPDLVLLDIELPQMNGIEVCRAITSDEATRGIPVIMVTINRDISKKLSSYIAGARRYITKPFGVDELVGEVRKTLRQLDIPASNLLDPRD